MAIDNAGCSNKGKLLPCSYAKTSFDVLFLGYFNENELRNKEQSVRLETNLV